MIAADVRPTLTPIAVTMPGQYRHSSMIGIIVNAAPLPPPSPSVVGVGLGIGVSSVALDLALEALPRHRVHAEGAEQLAQDVVGRDVAVLELLEVAA